MLIISRIFAAFVALAALCGIVQANYVGVPPLPGGDAALIDQNWLLGLAGGQNQSKLFGITAHAGGGQANAFQLMPGIALFQIDTVTTTNDSIALPLCKAPFQILVRNNGVNAAQVFTNPRPGSTDTINGTAGSTGISIAANTVTLFACIKDTQWSTVSGSGGGGGGGGTGTVTQINWGCGLSNSTPNPATTVGTGNGAIPIGNTVTSSTYAFQASDACNLLLLQPGAQTLTLPAATTPGFGSGNYWYVDNASATTVTLNITTSNLDGASSIAIVDAKAFGFQSDGTNYHYTINSSPGIGTVTNVSGTCGISSTNPTSSPLLSSNVIPVSLGASPAIVTGYCGGLVQFTASGTPTIAQAGSAGFGIGWYVTLCNLSSGTQTITPSGGTIGGLSSYTLVAGTPASPTCTGIVSDGISNYDVVSAAAGTVTSVSAGCGNSTGAGAIVSAGTVSAQIIPTVLTGSPAIVTSYCGGIEYLNNASLATPTLAEAGTAGFPAGWFTDLCNENSGAQVVSVATPGTIGGASTKSISSGSAAVPTCIRIISDGISNYFIR